MCVTCIKKIKKAEKDKLLRTNLNPFRYIRAVCMRKYVCDIEKIVNLKVYIKNNNNNDKNKN